MPLWAGALGVVLTACIGQIGNPGPAQPNNPVNPLNPDDPSCATAVGPAGTRLVRLTHAQYTNVVRQLLTLDATATPAADFQTDPTQGGFDNNADQLTVIGRLGRDYRRAAEDLALHTVTTPAAYGALVTCTPAGDGAACARETITRLLRRAFRRPATDPEVARYTALFARAPMLFPAGTDAFRGGVQVVLEAVLQSPNFLYRVELSRQEGLPGLIALGPYEVAARLSFMLWNSLPDDALDRAAEANQLATAEQVAAQAQRMLDDPRARSVVADFHTQWLHLSEYQALSRDPAQFPAFNPNLAGPMRQEALSFVDDVVFERRGGLDMLYTAPFTYVNDGLAGLYGLAGVTGSQMRRVDLPAERGGLFTQIGFLATHSYPTSTDPIHRGVFIHRQVLCTVIGSPPAGAAMTPLPPLMGDLHTMRQRVSAQTRADTCQGCHSFINTAGFAFENFNAVGQHQTTDNGVAVDATGTLSVDGHDVRFTNAVEFARGIAATDTARQCYVTQWFRYALQRVEAPTDRCDITGLSARMRAGTYGIRDLLRDLSQTRAFLYRPVERN